MVNTVICQLTFSQRQEAVRQLEVLIIDEGDGKSDAWRAGVRSCIMVLNSGTYQNQQYNPTTKMIELVDANDPYSHPNQAPLMSTEERLATDHVLEINVLLPRNRMQFTLDSLNKEFTNALEFQHGTEIRNLQIHNAEYIDELKQYKIRWSAETSPGTPVSGVTMVTFDVDRRDMVINLLLVDNK